METTGLAMKLRLHPQARAELLTSMIHYEAARPGLGNRFLGTVVEAMKNVQLSPESYPIFDGDCRKAVVRRFPYAVVYRVRETEVQVVSILHSKRDPESIRDRL